MTVSRVLPFALMLVIFPLGANAQFSGMPGMPGAPGGMPGMGGGFGMPQQGPPPVCQQLLSYRDETAKHGQALQAAGKRKATADEICKLFKAFIAAETKFVNALEENSGPCHVPDDAIKQVKLGHSKASETAKNVCEAAAAGRASVTPWAAHRRCRTPPLRAGGPSTL